MSKFGGFKVSNEVLAEVSAKHSVEKSLEGGPKKEPKVFQPGLHNVTIESVEDMGPTKSDASWVRYWVTYHGLGERRIRESILVPTTSSLFGDDEATFPFFKLQKFMGALGLSLTEDNAASVLEKTFGKPEKGLVGKKIAVKVGFRNMHCQMLKGGKFTLVNGKGQTVNGANKEPEVFSSREAAQLYCQTKSWKYSDFPEVLEVQTPTSEATVTPITTEKRAQAGF